MYNVSVEKQCGCFKKAQMPQTKSFESRDDALIGAKAWADEMNEKFCKKHNFDVIEDGEHFTIKVIMNS